MIAQVQSNPLLGMAIVAAALVTVFAALRLLQRASGVAPESIRKSFHVASSAIALALPWLFTDVWPVLALGASSIAGFLAMRVSTALRQGPGQVLQAVPRESAGEFWFTVGVVAIYLLARDDVVVYSLGILVLGVADTAAALVGIFYGKHRFDVPGGFKSAEGSFAFLWVAFLCVHVPLLLFTDVGRAESLLISLNVALLLMLAEADTSRGIDNLVLPVTVVFLLEIFLDNTVTELLGDLSVILALCVFVFVSRNRTTLSTDALIGAALTGYIVWLFGSWEWLVAPVVMLSTYTRLVGRPHLVESRTFHADVLLAIVAPAIAFVILYGVLGYPTMYFMYVAAWSANLAVIGTLHRQLMFPDQPVHHFALGNTVKALLILGAGLLVAPRFALPEIAAAVSSIPVALLAFGTVGRSLKDQPADPARWWTVTASVVSGVLVSFGTLALVDGLLT